MRKTRLLFIVLLVGVLLANMYLPSARSHNDFLYSEDQEHITLSVHPIVKKLVFTALTMVGGKLVEVFSEQPAQRDYHQEYYHFRSKPYDFKDYSRIALGVHADWEYGHIIGAYASNPIIHAYHRIQIDIYDPNNSRSA